ncbi:Plexin-A2 [Chamberlinius hualienensis]
MRWVSLRKSGDGNSHLDRCATESDDVYVASSLVQQGESVTPMLSPTRLSLNMETAGVICRKKRRKCESKCDVICKKRQTKKMGDKCSRCPSNGNNDGGGRRWSWRWTCHRMSLCTMLYVIALVFCSFSTISKATVVGSFSRNDTERFNHLVVDEHTGRLYIGAVNRLYQLSSMLQTQEVVITGPEDDSPDCPVNRDCPAATKRPTDNVNKALVIDNSKGILIACGSILQGICQVRKISNVSVVELKASEEAVVANNATASTVAFVAPGPPSPPETHVLYVGVSYTANGPYRSEVPAVSSRSLDSHNMFQISSVSVTTGTRMWVNSLERERYPINYVFGFHSRGFSYFLTTQKKFTSRAQPFISKLIRLCHRDKDYYSYTEIPIECKSKDGTDYNLAQAAYVGKPGSELANDLGITAQDEALFVVFSKSSDDQDVFNRPSDRSAFCVYSIKNIHRKFTENIQNCFSGNGDRGLDFINPSVKCFQTHLRIEDDFCGDEVNTPLGGIIPVEAVPVITYQGTLLTAVAAADTHDYTVAFLGTADGHLRKVAVESSSEAFEYSDLAIDEGSMVNPDLRFDKLRDHLYVMTERLISRLKVQNCNVYKNCGQCLGARDPYCGWCSLENKCSLRSDCAQAARDPLYWLPYKSGKCTTITSVHPHQIQRTTARTLMLTIDNLPTLSGNFHCAFTAFGKVLTTNASRTATGVSCPTPRTDTLPSIQQHQHHFTATLSVRRSSGPDFVATNFTFYDCNTYGECTECVSSPFPCDWCVDGHRCTHDTGENCRNDFLVTGVNNVGPSFRSGPSFCPKINASVTGSSEILVSSGMRRGITVKVDNIAQFLTQKHFVCQFNIEGRVLQVNAQLIQDTMYCTEMEFKYNSQAPNATVKFGIIWEGSKPLDNPEKVHVLVYRCRNMADNCGMCLALSEKYQCGWCESSLTCETKEQCDGGESAWLDQQKTCPNPKILSFVPTSGPKEGGTRVIIHGVNLGKNFEDIENGVTVAGVQCTPLEALYIKTSKIVCELNNLQIPSSANDGSHSGPVIVKVKDFRGESTTNFEFVEPRILGLKPIKGPKSGGTHLTVTGEYMNAGSNISAFMDAYPCEITHVDKSTAKCITSKATKPGPAKLRMEFDKGERSLTDPVFTYVEDPKIRSIESGGAPKSIPKGTPSGGIAFRVRGEHLDSIQEPKMFLRHSGNKYYSEPCVVESSTYMICLTPAISATDVAPNGSFGADSPIDLDYGFEMDDVALFRSMKSTKDENGQSFQPFYLYPDPVYYPFEEPKSIKYYKSDYLTINGENLDRACQESDVTVHIGMSVCNVTSLSRTQLTCRPPSSQPSARNVDGTSDNKRLPEVIVTVGGRLNFTIGKLSYESPRVIDGGLPLPVTIGVIAGGVVLFLIVIGILIAYRLKSTENSRVLKNMQEQMDVLELRVAAECKEAFAELQTEMTDLTSDLTSGGIPFLDYKTYAMKILFPNVEDHPVLKTDDMDPARQMEQERGLRMFGQLIMNKTFLLLFIRTLESNYYFSMRDRVNVASLIMVTLQSRMDYCTDVLKTLLAELIEKCIEGKSHPKLLLRRTESVAEKMLSSWFTFLLFKFLKECAGDPLFLLYRAIKQQVDKGPVDAITNEARYSLSEEKLIRQSIEYKSMSVYVSMSPQTMYPLNLDTDNTNVPVKVLDCDTISQVKEKALDAIYRNTPFSQRPAKDDLDLEWRTGTTGRLILSDEDQTSKFEGDWRKLNTLNHYKVPDGALLTLVLKQASNYNLSIVSEKSEKSHKYETLNFHKFSSASPPLSRATSPLNNDMETGYKYCHLVKHHDNDAQKEGERGNKMVSEIYLTRLLATKGTLQKFVNDLFETIFSTAHRGSALPLAIKYMFDFLDDQAIQHQITDPEVVHTWKSNSLPLRFWVNLIKNPNFVFDIHKSHIVDSCLSVVAQTFMDACSTSDHRLGKDSPSSKLLYAKDIPTYKLWVESYYREIKMMPAISDQDMNSMLAEESRLHTHEFNTNVALHELYNYAVKYNDQLMQTLQEDEFSKKNRLAQKLEQVHNIMGNNAAA